jgi:hypothetical protein
MTVKQSCRAALLAVLVFAAGCGKQSGSLTGKVLLNGEAIRSGRVQALASGEAGEQVIAASSIQEDGTYHLSDLPLGPVTLVVVTHRPDGQPLDAPVLPSSLPGGKPLPEDVARTSLQAQPEGVRKAVESARPVPLKYTDAKQSELKVTVARGETSYDIQMSGKGEVPRMIQPTGRPGAPPGIPPPPMPPGPGFRP